MSSVEKLTVLIAEHPVGTVIVNERYPRKILGKFIPGPGFEQYRPVFENAVELARQFDATSVAEPCDYELWDRLMAAYAEINRLGLQLLELPGPIEEFGIGSDWSVEVTF